MATSKKSAGTKVIKPPKVDRLAKASGQLSRDEKLEQKNLGKRHVFDDKTTHRDTRIVIPRQPPIPKLESQVDVLSKKKR